PGSRGKGSDSGFSGLFGSDRNRLVRALADGFLRSSRHDRRRIQEGISELTGKQRMRDHAIIVAGIVSLSLVACAAPSEPEAAEPPAKPVERPAASEVEAEPEGFDGRLDELSIHEWV